MKEMKEMKEMKKPTPTPKGDFWEIRKLKVSQVPFRGLGAKKKTTLFVKKIVSFCYYFKND